MNSKRCCFRQFMSSSSARSDDECHELHETVPSPTFRISTRNVKVSFSDDLNIQDVSSRLLLTKDLNTHSTNRLGYAAKITREEMRHEARKVRDAFIEYADVYQLYNFQNHYSTHVKRKFANNSDAMKNRHHSHCKHQNYTTRQRHQIEKATYCRPVSGYLNQELLFKNLENKQRLQNIVKKLAEAREKEKQKHAWDCYIKQLRLKHGGFDTRTQLESLAQSGPSTFMEQFHTENDYNTNITPSQLNNCNNLLEDLYKTSLDEINAMKIPLARSSGFDLRNKDDKISLTGSEMPYFYYSNMCDRCSRYLNNEKNIYTGSQYYPTRISTYKTQNSYCQRCNRNGMIRVPNYDDYQIKKPKQLLEKQVQYEYNTPRSAGRDSDMQEKIYVDKKTLENIDSKLDRLYETVKLLITNNKIYNFRNVETNEKDSIINSNENTNEPCELSTCSHQECLVKKNIFEHSNNINENECLNPEGLKSYNNTEKKWRVDMLQKVDTIERRMRNINEKSLHRDKNKINRQIDTIKRYDAEKNRFNKQINEPKHLAETKQNYKREKLYQYDDKTEKLKKKPQISERHNNFPCSSEEAAYHKQSKEIEEKIADYFKDKNIKKNNAKDSRFSFCQGQVGQGKGTTYKYEHENNPRKDPSESRLIEQSSSIYTKLKSLAEFPSNIQGYMDFITCSDEEIVGLKNNNEAKTKQNIRPPGYKLKTSQNHIEEMINKNKNERVRLEEEMWLSEEKLSLSDHNGDIRNLGKEEALQEDSKQIKESDSQDENINKEDCDLEEGSVDQQENDINDYESVNDEQSENLSKFHFRDAKPKPRKFIEKPYNEEIINGLKEQKSVTKDECESPARKNKKPYLDQGLNYEPTQNHKDQILYNYEKDSSNLEGGGMLIPEEESKHYDGYDDVENLDRKESLQRVSKQIEERLAGYYKNKIIKNEDDEWWCPEEGSYQDKVQDEKTINKYVAKGYTEAPRELDIRNSDKSRSNAYNSIKDIDKEIIRQIKEEKKQDVGTSREKQLEDENIWKEIEQKLQQDKRELRGNNENQPKIRQSENRWLEGEMKRSEQYKQKDLEISKSESEELVPGAQDNNRFTKETKQNNWVGCCNSIHRDSTMEKLIPIDNINESLSAYSLPCSETETSDNIVRKKKLCTRKLSIIWKSIGTDKKLTKPNRRLYALITKQTAIKMDKAFYDKDSSSKIQDILEEEMNKSNKAKKDIDDILNGDQSKRCSVDISFDVPIKERCTEVTDSLSKAHIGAGNSPVATQRSTKRLTIAVNTDPLSLCALLQVSKETIGRLLSFVHFDYHTLLPIYNNFCSDSNEINQVGRHRNIVDQLRMPTNNIQEQSVDRNRECCVCRHLLEVSKNRPPGVFKCHYCDKIFTRAYCRELHEQKCAAKHGYPHDVPENLAYLS